MGSAKHVFLGAALAALVLGLGGCERKQEIDGAGYWRVGKTVRADFKGVCNPHDDRLVVCQIFGQKIALDEHHGAIPSLYFEGDAPDAKLVELLLDIGGCRPDQLRAWLKNQLGEPDEAIGPLAVWKGKNSVKLAQLPAEPARCEVSFVAVGDTKRVAEIKASVSE